jgi:hypothetical protein
MFLELVGFCQVTATNKGIYTILDLKRYGIEMEVYKMEGHKMLALADMTGKSEDQVKHHLAENYAGKEKGFSYGNPSKNEKQELQNILSDYSILVAYESVGSWGCDSSSWFLLQHKEIGSYGVISGSHCSCYGFEGQGEVEETDIDYLTSDRFYFYTGGYDDDAKDNTKKVKKFLKKLKKKVD